MTPHTLLLPALAATLLAVLVAGQEEPSGLPMAQVERAVYAHVQEAQLAVSDVRCVPRNFDEASCVALLGDATRLAVAARVDDESGRLVFRNEGSPGHPPVPRTGAGASISRGGA